MYEYVKGLSVNRARKTSASVIVFCTLDGAVQVAWNLRKSAMYVRKSSVVEYFGNYNSAVYGTGNVFDNVPAVKPVQVYICGDAIEYIDSGDIVELCSAHRTNVFTMFWDTVYFEAEMAAAEINAVDPRRLRSSAANATDGQSYVKTSRRPSVSVNLLPEFDKCTVVATDSIGSDGVEKDLPSRKHKRSRTKRNWRRKRATFWKLSTNRRVADASNSPGPRPRPFKDDICRRWSPAITASTVLSIDNYRNSHY